MINFDLKTFREKNGIKQEDLAKILGVRPNTIRNYEKDSSCLSLKQIEKIALSLGKTEEYLLGFKNNDILNSELCEISKKLNLSDEAVKKLISIGKKEKTSKFVDLFLKFLDNDEFLSFSNQILQPKIDNEFMLEECITYIDYYRNFFFDSELDDKPYIYFRKTINKIKSSEELADYFNNKLKKTKYDDEICSDLEIKRATEEYENPPTYDELPPMNLDDIPLCYEDEHIKKLTHERKLKIEKKKKRKQLKKLNQ